MLPVVVHGDFQITCRRQALVVVRRWLAEARLVGLNIIEEVVASSAKVVPVRWSQQQTDVPIAPPLKRLAAEEEEREVAVVGAHVVSIKPTPWTDLPLNLRAKLTAS